MNFTAMVQNMLNDKHYRVKAFVHVPAIYKRDAQGRFVGGLRRKAYSYRTLDRDAPMVTSLQLLAESVTAHNSLLARLQERGKLKEA